MTHTLKAHVRDGRLVLNEPIELPDGTQVELVLADNGDQLDASDRERLHAALARSAEQFARGEGIAADVVMKKLREPRSE